MSRKFVRDLAKMGAKMTAEDGSVGYVLPYVVIRDDSMPAGTYTLIKLSELKDEVLAHLGLKKLEQ